MMKVTYERDLMPLHLVEELAPGDCFIDKEEQVWMKRVKTEDECMDTVYAVNIFTGANAELSNGTRRRKVNVEARVVL